MKLKKTTSEEQSIFSLLNILDDTNTAQKQKFSIRDFFSKSD